MAIVETHTSTNRLTLIHPIRTNKIKITIFLCKYGCDLAGERLLHTIIRFRPDNRLPLGTIHTSIVTKLFYRVNECNAVKILLLKIKTILSMLQVQMLYFKLYSVTSQLRVKPTDNCNKVFVLYHICTWSHSQITIHV